MPREREREENVERDGIAERAIGCLARKISGRLIGSPKDKRAIVPGREI